jgi:propanol-preferring alcohol dehydrogenase
MKALQYRAIGTKPEVVMIDDPVPGPGQVLLKVTAAGACHSDDLIMSLPMLMYPLPMTLGHEGAGEVVALGEGTTGVSVGDAVAVYGPWGCGRCSKCAQGKENYCLNAAAEGIRPPGLGAPGAMAEYMIVDDPRHLIPLNGLDPVKNVPLTDAGLTPYHAIKNSISKLGAGSTAVVIGAGGLGHMGIQILRAMTGATIIALDVSGEKLEFAQAVGAHHTVLSNGDAVTAVKAITGAEGATAVFDFVGAPATTKIAAGVVGSEGDISIVGIAGGTVPVGFQALPHDVSVRSPYWGSRSELMEVLELARRGQISVEVETFTLDEAPRAYELLHEGKLRGRAVIVPNG